MLKGSIDVPGNRRDSIDERDTVYDRIRTGIMGVTSYIPSINTVLRGTSAPELGDVSDPLSPSPQSTTMETPLALGKAAEPNRAFIRFVRKQERTITDLKSQIEELSAKSNSFAVGIGALIVYNV